MTFEIAIVIGFVVLLVLIAMQDFQIKNLKFETELSKKKLESMVSKFVFDLQKDKVERINDKISELRTDFYTDIDRCKQSLSEKDYEIEDQVFALANHLNVSIAKVAVVEKK